MCRPTVCHLFNINLFLHKKDVILRSLPLLHYHQVKNVPYTCACVDLAERLWSKLNILSGYITEKMPWTPLPPPANTNIHSTPPPPPGKKSGSTHFACVTIRKPITGMDTILKSILTNPQLICTSIPSPNSFRLTNMLVLFYLAWYMCL